MNNDNRFKSNRVLKFSVCDRYVGKQLKVLLKDEFGISTNHLKRMKKLLGYILVNGEDSRLDRVLLSGDIVEVNVNDICDKPEVPLMEGNLDIVYEDDFLLVINKGAGMVVHSAPGRREEASVANLVMNYLWGKGDKCLFHAINRLDRGTTGLMVIAKCGYIHSLLMNELHTDNFERQYLAVVCGRLKDKSGMIDYPIARKEDSVIERVISEDGDSSLTEYVVEKNTGEYSLVRLWARTGRTHQLRVHMSAVGCPLAGDFLYGVEDTSLIERAALHSTYLSFIHPVTKEKIVLESEIPEDMKKIIEEV